MTVNKIAQLVRARGITSLYHFTPMVNLQSILTHGLLSTQVLQKGGIVYTYTDSWRNDDQPAAVSLSIHRINRSMFAKKRREFNRRWAILQIDAQVLWTHKCRFCWVNASTTEIVNHSRIEGPWAFNQMFADRAMRYDDPRSFRAVYKIPANMPTRNDAEVQVLRPIAPELIRNVSVARESCARIAEAAMHAAGRTLEVWICPETFS